MEELQEELEQQIIQSKNELKYLKFEELSNEHVVTLIDETGYEIIRGYGNTIIEAINDLHSNLI
jgi:hypothetical protein